MQRAVGAVTEAGRQMSGISRDGLKDTCRDAVRCALVVGLSLASSPLRAGEHNRLSDAERELGFELLFDGESMGRWRNFRSKDIRLNWQVIDGAMVMTAKGRRDLVTKVDGKSG